MNRDRPLFTSMADSCWIDFPNNVLEAKEDVIDFHDLENGLVGS